MSEEFGQSIMSHMLFIGMCKVYGKHRLLGNVSVIPYMEDWVPSDYFNCSPQKFNIYRQCYGEFNINDDWITTDIEELEMFVRSSIEYLYCKTGAIERVSWVQNDPAIIKPLVDLCCLKIARKCRPEDVFESNLPHELKEKIVISYCQEDPSFASTHPLIVFKYHPDRRNKLLGVRTSLCKLSWWDFYMLKNKKVLDRKSSDLAKCQAAAYLKTIGKIKKLDDLHPSMVVKDPSRLCRIYLNLAFGE
jgi:hypothetical protein